MANEHLKELEKLKHEVHRAVVLLCGYQEEIEKLSKLDYTPNTHLVAQRLRLDLDSINHQITNMIRIIEEK